MVETLVGQFQLSERRACLLSGIARSSARYVATTPDDAGVIAFIEAYLRGDPRHGFGLMLSRGRYAGNLPCGKTRLNRVYRQLGMNLPRRGKKRLLERVKCPLEVPSEPNQSWSMDFMADGLDNGKKVRTFNVIDDFNREALKIEIDTSLPSQRVVRALEEIVQSRGAPQSIRSDNGPEFIAQALKTWAQDNQIILQFIQPGSPTQNAYIERFNRTYRTEILDCYLFDTLDELRDMTEIWMKKYNEQRPHEALGGVPPVPYRINKFPQTLYF